jgi:hypothetical protein
MVVGWALGSCFRRSTEPEGLSYSFIAMLRKIWLRH